MRTKVLWSLLLVGFTMGGCWAQEQRPSKQDQPTFPATSASGKQVLHRYNISTKDKLRKNPVGFTEWSVDRGKKLFQAQCVLCHGVNADGQGDFAGVSGLHPPAFNKPGSLSKRTDGELFVIIGTGSEKMPGRHLQMTEKQRWDTINYLRTVEGKTPAKTSDQKKQDTAILQRRQAGGHRPTLEISRLSVQWTEERKIAVNPKCNAPSRKEPT